jgi:hypothetical protein
VDFDKLERQLAALEAHPEAAVAYSWTQTIDEQGHWLIDTIRYFLKEMFMLNFS